MLELPALTTRMVSDTAQARIGCFAIWLWRSRAATAQEAMRVRTWSAREVRMIGTRAPSTMPAARRRRARPAGGARLIKYGLPGTDMPGHETLSDAEILALTARVLELRR